MAFGTCLGKNNEEGGGGGFVFEGGGGGGVFVLVLLSIGKEIRKGRDLKRKEATVPRGNLFRGAKGRGANPGESEK